MAGLAQLLILYRDNLGELEEYKKIIKEGRERSIIDRQETLSGLTSHLNEDIASGVTKISDHCRNLSNKSIEMFQVLAKTKKVVETAQIHADSNVELFSTTSKLADGMKTAISDVTRQSDNINTIVGKASRSASESHQAISDFSQASEQIIEFVDTIQKISDQTNLLALNATIEAMRAGDAGRGFAVVASEVKQLANQTNKAAEAISNQVSLVTERTEYATKIIQDITGDIESVPQAHRLAVLAMLLYLWKAHWKMVAGPPESAVGGRLQTTSSGWL